MLSCVEPRPSPGPTAWFDDTANELNDDRVSENDFHTCKASFGLCVVEELKARAG